MILMVTNKHEESVALCIYQFPGVIGFWNCWFPRKGKMGAGKEKKPLEERKRTNNRINSNITMSLRFKIWSHIWWEWVLPQLHHSCLFPTAYMKVNSQYITKWLTTSKGLRYIIYKNTMACSPVGLISLMHRVSHPIITNIRVTILGQA